MGNRYDFLRRYVRSLRHLPIAIALTICWAATATADELDPVERDQQLNATITRPAGTVPIHWRVTWKTDPGRQAVVSWDTLEEGTTHRLHLHSEGGELKETIDCQRNGGYTDPQNPQLKLYYHHARLIDLEPASKYFVQFESDGNKSAEFWFLTAPSEDQAVRLLFGGDSRSSQTQRRSMNRRISRLVAEMPDIVALAHGGDYIEDGRKLEQWWKWLNDHELTVTDAGRLLPIIPARGNHDPGPIFNEIFDFPVADLNYYAVDLTPQVRLITLNSETSMAGDQKKWLASELARSRPQRRWLVAQYHRPAWPAVKRPSAALQHFVPLFEKHNVNMVCEADGHVLKRTVPIRDGKRSNSGVVYVGEGGLGVGQRRPETDRWYLQKPGMAASGHHVQLLTFHADRLDYKVVGMDGSTLDSHALLPH